MTGTATINCSVGTLANGATATITLMARIMGSGNVTNSATASSAVADGTPTNNTGSAGFAVIEPNSVPSLDARMQLLLALLLAVTAVVTLRMKSL